MKKVGIIGSSGFIGSYNTKKFLEEGKELGIHFKPARVPLNKFSQ